MHGVIRPLTWRKPFQARRSKIRSARAIAKTPVCRQRSVDGHRRPRLSSGRIARTYRMTRML